MDNLNIIGQIGQKSDTLDIKLDNLDRVGQFGHNWTIWTELDNLDWIGQFGHKLDKLDINWTVRSKLDRIGHWMKRKQEKCNM